MIELMPFAILLPLLVSFAAQQVDATFDAAGTRILWTLTGNIHAVHGTFRLLSGSAHFEASSGTVSGEFVADGTSGESGSGSRDKHMHKEVLESATYPKIVFVPKAIRGAVATQGTSHVEIDGTFTLHGAAHPFTIPADLVTTGDKVTIKARFEIPYVEWGLKNPSNFLFKVDPKVTIDMETTGRLASSH